MLGDISVFLLQALSSLILIVIMLRFLLQAVRANFRNPLAQAIVQLTSPLVVPVRRIVPAIGNIDTATLVVAYAAQVVLLAALMLLIGAGISSQILIDAVFALANLTINIFFFAIIIGVVLSWVAPGSYNPAGALADELARPLLTPIRRVIPPFSGFDLSPLFAMLLIGVIRIVVNHLHLMVRM
ncbi:MAG: YggT family protein [Pseudomonadota bacterium]